MYSRYHDFCYTMRFQSSRGVCSSDFRSIKLRKQSDDVDSDELKLVAGTVGIQVSFRHDLNLLTNACTYPRLCQSRFKFQAPTRTTVTIFNFVLSSVSSTLHALAAWAHACGEIWGKIGIWLHKYFKVRHTLHYPDQGSLAVVRLEVRGLP